MSGVKSRKALTRIFQNWCRNLNNSGKYFFISFGWFWENSVTLHPSPGGPHIDKCISPNTIRMTLCLGEKRFYVLSICYTHLDKILLANVKQGYLFERSTLTFLPVAENTHLKFFFFLSFISSCMSLSAWT